MRRVLEGIAGERPGSGNTANIGSIKRQSLDDFRSGAGPFAEGGEAVFRGYWANYVKDAKRRPYSTVAQYIEWAADR